MPEQSGSTTGQSTGSGYDSKNIQENWNTPISQLNDQIKSNASNTQDYFMVTTDSKGGLNVYSNRSKDGGSTFLQNVQDKLGSLFTKEGISG